MTFIPRVYPLLRCYSKQNTISPWLLWQPVRVAGFCTPAQGMGLPSPSFEFLLFLRDYFGRYHADLLAGVLRCRMLIQRVPLVSV